VWLEVAIAVFLFASLDIKYWNMSLNTAHANGGVLIHAGEWLVMYHIIC
jgi:hypothetical protein